MARKKHSAEQIGDADRQEGGRSERVNLATKKLT